ncbi:metalloregulator ArsR/SmtB family transcription factor [Leptolyngbya sp. 15MV]|nr:metalloregulator ArsR/SmtB family transcription factor [Leptolyngbya sp. 15MV]
MNNGSAKRNGQDASQADLRRKAALLRAVAHPTRLAILRELRGGVKCVADILELLPLPQPNVSQHLQVLRREQIVDSYEDGNLRCYYLTQPRFVELVLKTVEQESEIITRSAQSVCRERSRTKACCES